jgi:UDP-glucose 4-epimerase
MTDINRTSGQIFNVGANNQISILALAERIKKLVGSDSPTLHIPFDKVYGSGIEDMLHRVPCIDKVRDTIGWTPRLTLEDILADVTAHLAAELKIAA